MEVQSQQEGSVVSVSTRLVRDLYEAKTAAILRRYGPGPRVHYHTGFVDDTELPSEAQALRKLLVESQERMLKYTSASWNFKGIKFQDLLDVGCGLGGTSIFIAQKFGARVTAITIARSHIEIIARFARQAGVESRVMPVVCDAASVRGRNRFDVAIAIESSSLFDRGPWFQCLAEIIRPKGRIFIFDCFLSRCQYEEPFNQHWCANIGTSQEYLDAARNAGFKLVAIEDTSNRTARFWRTTAALIKAETSEMKPDQLQLRAIEDSYETHELMRRGLLDGGLQQLSMSFVKLE